MEMPFMQGALMNEKNLLLLLTFAFSSFDPSFFALTDL